MATRPAASTETASIGERESLVQDVKSPPYGEGFKITLTCPQCATTAWVAWKRLTHSLRCPKCRCQFLIGPHGKLLKPEDLPQTRYSCPRCGAAGSVPTMLTVRRAECMSCKLPLAHGPDQQLHGVKEAAELQRQTLETLRELRASGTPKWLQALSLGLERRLGKLSLAVVAIVAASAIWYVGSAIASLFAHRPDRHVIGFVDCCLRGDEDAAEDYLPDDDVERVEFDRWRVRNFASIIEKFRPAGDHAEITAKLLSETPDARSFEITMKSPFLGERKQRQEWRLRDGDWRFSPVETLARQDGRRAANVAPSAPARKLTPRDRNAPAN